MQTVYNNALQSDINKSDVVLLMGFYLTKSKKCNFKSEIIDKEFIKQYLETKNVSINKNEFEKIKKSLLKFIKNFCNIFNETLILPEKRNINKC